MKIRLEFTDKYIESEVKGYQIWRKGNPPDYYISYDQGKTFHRMNTSDDTRVKVLK